MGSRRHRALVVSVVAAVCSVSAGCAYHAGTAAAESFDAWVQDHPIRGARVVDTVGNNKYAFAGALTAYARLTAEPSEQGITEAMSDLCDYDEVAKVPTTYWLQVERISMQVVCTEEGRTALAGFYAAVVDLTTLDHVYLDRTGVEAEAPDAVVPEVAGQVFTAADASGTVGDGATYTFTGEHVRVTAGPGVDLAPELDAAAAILPVVGGSVSMLKVTDGLLVAETTGSVADAQRWQGEVTAQSGATLLVTPARVTSDVALTPAQRTLVDGLSTDARVALVSTYPDHWVVDVVDSAGARPLLVDLAAEPAAAQLGELTLERVVDFRSCWVTPGLPTGGGVDPSADALLGLCERDDMASVDGRFGYLDVRMTGDDLRAVLVAAHTLPAGTEVTIRSEGAETSGSYDFTTGETLSFDQSFDSNAELQDIWATLGPYAG